MEKLIEDESRSSIPLAADIASLSPPAVPTHRWLSEDSNSRCIQFEARPSFVENICATTLSLSSASEMMESNLCSTPDRAVAVLKK